MQSWILLVDDDPEDRDIIMEAMEEAHAFQLFRYAENGEQAIAKLKDINPQQLPALIVLDLNMPKMNGTQTLRKLKSDDRFKNIPVIIYSTSINPLEMEKCMQLGAHSYVTKPVSIKESLETAKLFFRFCEGNGVEGEAYRSDAKK